VEGLTKILYVDDEHINLFLFEQMFRKSFIVVTADSGYRGLEIIKNDPEIKVIISDMRMNGMNGLEFVKTAKETYPHLLFYILTGYEITPEIKNALETGMIIRYFQKPFNKKEIEKHISEKTNPE